MQPSREPLLNVPAAVILIIGVFVGVHLLRTFGLSARGDGLFLLLFAFFPGRFDSSTPSQLPWPGGWAADVWTFVTYAFIHGDWMHLAFNALWFLPFGSAVARRFGAWRFLAFFAITAAAGAAAHLFAQAGDNWPMVGASAAISGCMAASLRFVFQAGGPLGLMRSGRHGAYRVPAAPLWIALRDLRVLAFLGVWFGLNLLFGVSSFSLVDDGQSIAWQAHIGGFLAGLLLFPLFDPVERVPAPHGDLDWRP